MAASAPEGFQADSRPAGPATDRAMNNVWLLVWLLGQALLGVGYRSMSCFLLGMAGRCRDIEWRVGLWVLPGLFLDRDVSRGRSNDYFVL